MDRVKIGWGRREVSIDEPVSIPGQMYMRISEGIHDPLYVTALCVQGAETVIFCSCDIVVLRGGVINATKEKVAAMRPELPVDSIVMGATHTHSAAAIGATPEKSPDGREIYPGLQYREFFIQMCAEAICEAWDNRCEGGMTYGYGYAVVAHSRRTCYDVDMSTIIENKFAPNGHAIMYGNTKDPHFSHYEAGADHFVNLMYTFDRDSKLTGIVVNVPCPSQLSERFEKLSADYWNEVRQEVAKEFGEHVFVLPQCAAAGDLSPRVMHYKEAQARRMGLKHDLPYEVELATGMSDHEYNKVMGERKDIAERIVSAIREVYSWASKDIQTHIPVCFEKLELDLSRRMISDEEKAGCEKILAEIAEKVIDPEKYTPEKYSRLVSRQNSLRNRQNGALERYATQNEEPYIHTRACVARIGDIAFATTRFELYMDFMHRVQARSPFIQTFVVQLAGDENGRYLPTQRGKEDKGYSASIFCNSVGPEGGQEWVESVLESLNKMAEN